MAKSCDTCHVKPDCAQKFEAKQPDFSSAFEGAAPTADDPAPEPKWKSRISPGVLDIYHIS